MARDRVRDCRSWTWDPQRNNGIINWPFFTPSTWLLIAQFGGLLILLEKRFIEPRNLWHFLEKFSKFLSRRHPSLVESLLTFQEELLFHQGHEMVLFRSSSSFRSAWDANAPATSLLINSCCSQVVVPAAALPSSIWDSTQQVTRQDIALTFQGDWTVSHGRWCGSHKCGVNWYIDGLSITKATAIELKDNFCELWLPFLSLSSVLPFTVWRRIFIHQPWMSHNTK